MLKGFQELFNTIYEIESPWEVIDCAKVSGTSGPTIEVVVQHGDKHNLSCPDCGHLVGPAHDTRRRRWRAADWEWDRVFITCQIPRIQCPVHGFRQLPVPWAETDQQITRSLERRLIDELSDRSVMSVAKQMGLSWGVVHRVKARAVKRGFERR